jgi:hypothetical protein
MTRDEIKNTPEIVDYLLDKSVIADSRKKLHNRLCKICNLAIKALDQEPIFSRILDKTYNDFCNCDGGEGWLEIDGKEYVTDAGYAIKGVEIFMEIFKRRLAESEGKK